MKPALTESLERECYTIDELAAVMQVRRGVVVNLTKQPGFPVKRFGERTIRIPVLALREWLARTALESNNQPQPLPEFARMPVMGPGAVRQYRIGSRVVTTNGGFTT